MDCQYGIFRFAKSPSKEGVKTWNRVTTDWAKMLLEVKFIEPQCFEEFLSCSVWWNPYPPAIGPGFSRNGLPYRHPFCP